MSKSTRIEHDSLGSLEVPAKALYGAQTQRAINNFPISGRQLPIHFIHAIVQIKRAGAKVNGELELLPRAIVKAIISAADEVLQGAHGDQFPVDIFQTGSGTSTNMNVNEVLAHLAGKHLGKPVHANDEVNLGQSSNDVIPSAISISAALSLERQLFPAMRQLAETIDHKAESLTDTIKMGRTHLMDAMPLSLGQELSGWAASIRSSELRLQSTLPRLLAIPLGGTAVGTGVNTHPEFSTRISAELAAHLKLPLTTHPNFFEAMATQETSVELAGQLRTYAIALMKIANDLRWMNSGPLAGLAEIELPLLQPGSSIMPGKVNPVIAEAVAMVCAQVIGYDTSITIAGQSGNFQLNVMLPLIAYNLLDCISLMSNASSLLATQAIAGFSVKEQSLAHAIARNPILATALNPLIGYEKASKIAQAAYAQNRPIIDVAAEMTDLNKDELARLLDPRNLIHGGLKTP